jgi:hypothetical protein
MQDITALVHAAVISLTCEHPPRATPDELRAKSGSGNGRHACADAVHARMCGEVKCGGYAVRIWWRVMLGEITVVMPLAICLALRIFLLESFEARRNDVQMLSCMVMLH